MGLKVLSSIGELIISSCIQAVVLALFDVSDKFI